MGETSREPPSTRDVDVGSRVDGCDPVEVCPERERGWRLAPRARLSVRMLVRFFGPVRPWDGRRRMSDFRRLTKPEPCGARITVEPLLWRSGALVDVWRSTLRVARPE